MAKISILFAFLPHLLCTMVQGQLSPCSKYFTYVSQPGTIDMLGQIEIPSPSENDEFHLRVALNTDAELPKHLNSSVRLELAQSIKGSIRAAQQGRPLLYHVYFPWKISRPEVSGIWFNNLQYCPDLEATGNIRVAILLGHIIYSPNEEPLSQNSRPNGPSHRNVNFYSTINPNHNYLNYLTHSRLTTVTPSNEIANLECGITSYYTDDTNRQISNGKETSAGQWPWLVALFVLIPNEETAHCLKLGSFGNAIDPHDLFVVFGQFNLRQYTRGTHRVVARYMIHPDAKIYTRDSDLAILILQTPIEYSPFIKPICLWSGSTNFQNIVNKMGYVVGWGKNECDNNNTEEPLMARMPIVNMENCYWIWFSSPVISDRIFCAGLRYENGFCNVDGGNGLVLFDVTTGRYQLRGIVTRTILFGFDPFFFRRKYVVYVDVAKYIPWIQQQISAV